MDKISKNLEIKTPLSNGQKDKLLSQISEAKFIIEAEEESLRQHKEEAKGKMQEQEDIISSCIATYRRGYESKMVECYATYDKDEVTFTNVQTGEIEEQRPITEAEQLQLSEHRIDAEQLIRADSKNN